MYPSCKRMSIHRMKTESHWSMSQQVHYQLTDFLCTFVVRLHVHPFELKRPQGHECSCRSCILSSCDNRHPLRSLKTNNRLE
ncbi:hypothetical protein Hanom_Chr01g00067761 [Helianthus anomalus]